MTDKDMALLDMVRQFEEAEDATRDARLLAQRDRDYFDEKQWTAEEQAELKSRGQPVVTFNRIKRKVNALQGIEKQNRKDPRAFPRNPDDEDAAQAATDALRYVCDNSNWDDKRSEASKELAIEGTCAIMVGVEKTKAGYDPAIRRISWDRFYYDPASSEFDFADASYMGVVVWMDLADAVRKYPDAKDALEGTWARARDTETYDDKPKNGFWADYKRKRIRLCEHYYNDGGWKFCIFTQAGYVVEPQDSPYMGEDGPECPIKAVSLYIDRDNNRYGEVRTMIGPQDEINKRRSKALHLISQRQVRVDPATGLDAKAIRKEMARPDGIIMGAPGDVEILPTNDMAAANVQLLQEAKAEIDMLGPNAAMQGKNETAMSGRALIAQQQGGMTESATYLDRVRVLSMAVYRSIWCRVRQFWKEERWVRVTDNEQNLRFVGINRPVTMLEMAAKQLGVDPKDLSKAPPEAVQQLQMIAQDPRARMVAGVENAVNELDVDIILDEGMDTPTIAAEQFDILAKMLPALGPVGQSPEVLKLLIQASALRNKDSLLKLFEPKDQQGPSPEEQMQQQAQMQMQLAQQQAQMDGEVEIEKAKINAMADIEVAKIKAEADHEIKQQQLRTEVALETERKLAEAEAQAQADEVTGKRAMTDAEAQDRRTQVEAMAQLAQAIAEMTRPKTKVPVRDELGNIIAVRDVYEDAA
jgi:hypothetical protein